MLELARQLALTIESPVWDKPCAPAPWAQKPASGRAGGGGGGGEKWLKSSIARRPLAVNPLKASQPIGAALAFLGLRNSLPMLHGSQGCTAFGKVFFVRHFREPIPLQTTAMDQVSTIMSADENVIEGLRVLCEKSART
jgi:nitrogenase molybdenum-iron protein alpha/beta subunit